MIAVLQRVKRAEVRVSSKVAGKIGRGILIFLGVQHSDTQKDAGYLADKIAQLRIFEDNKGKMNLSIQEAKGEFLVVSQFTLLGNCSDGRRPSFDAAAKPQLAEALYENFIEKLKEYSLPVEKGKFRAMMDVELINDGPVTFIIDSRNA